MDSSNRKFDDGYIGLDYLFRNPDVRDAIGMKYDEKSLFNSMYRQSNMRKTDQTTYHRWEFDRLFETVTIASAAGTGDERTLTLNAASHNDSGTTSPFKVGDIIQLNASGAKVRVVAKNPTSNNAHVLTVRLTGNGDVFPANGSLTNTVAWWYGTAFADGSGQPTSMVRKPSRLDNHVQILKSTVITYGSESADKYKVKTTVGNKEYFYYQSVEDLMTRHIAAIELTLLNGDKAIGTGAATGEASANHPDGGARPIYYTGGLNWYIAKSGYGAVSYTNSTFDESQMDRIAKRLNTEQAGMEYEVYVEHDLKLEMDRTLRDINGNTGVTFTYGTFNGNKELAAQLGFSQYSYGSRTFHVKVWNLLSEPQTAGNAYKNTAFFMPTGQYQGALAQGTLRAKEIRYKQGPEENRLMVEWQRGREQTNIDQHEWNVQSELGLDMGLLNQCVKFQIA